MKKVWAVVGLAVGLVASGAGAAPGAAVYCGTMQCMTLKAEAHGQSPDQRAERAMNCLNKYLGGKIGKFSTKQVGTDVQILLNGEVLVAVTPADARQEKAKTVAALAAAWRTALTKAFAQTRAQR